MSKINLQAFCDLKRDNIKRPFTINEFVYATNGKVIIRTKQDYNDYSPNVNAPNDIIIKMPWGLTGEELIDFPLIKKRNPEMELCEECHGSGIVDWWTDSYHYSAECKDCEGIGSVKKLTTDKLGNSWFENRFLCLVSTLGNVKYYKKSTKYGLHFFFKKGEGFLINCFPEK